MLENTLLFGSNVLFSFPLKIICQNQITFVSAQWIRMLPHQ